MAAQNEAINALEQVSFLVALSEGSEIIRAVVVVV